MTTKRKQAGGRRRKDTGVKAAAAGPPERPVEDIPPPAAPLEQPAQQTSQPTAPVPPPGPGPRGAPDMLFTPEGMIEEREWHPQGLRERRPEEKSLQELIASVLTVPAPEQPLEDVSAEVPPAALETAPAPPAVEPAPDDPEAREEAARRRLRLIAYLGLLAFVLFAGVFLFVTAGGGSGRSLDPGAAQPAEVPAAPPDGAAGPPPDNQVAAQPPPAAEPAPAVAPVETPTPAPPPPPQVTAPPPPPTAPPPPPPTPVPPIPPPPPPPVIHVADLDGGTPGQKAAVRVHVHDAAHNPVAGATVTGLWTGAYTGPASCVTDTTGWCNMRTDALSVRGSVIFTVTMVSLGNAVYDGGANHDPDGDSNGTSITIAA